VNLFENTSAPWGIFVALTKQSKIKKILAIDEKLTDKSTQ